LPLTVAVTTGAFGTVAGVLWTVVLAAPSPMVLTALTRNEYVVPLVKPVTATAGTTVFEFGTATLKLTPSVDVSTRYPTMGLPPSLTGAVNVSTTEPSPGVVFNAVGAPGKPAGITEAGVDAAPTPLALMARTRNKYDVPFVRPLTLDVVDVDIVSETFTDHVAPLSDDCSMR
jgi:hypothetical protein